MTATQEEFIMKHIEIIIAESYHLGELVARQLQSNPLILKLDQVFLPPAPNESMGQAVIRNSKRLEDLTLIDTDNRSIFIVGLGQWIDDPCTYVRSSLAAQQKVLHINSKAIPSLHGKLVHGLWAQCLDADKKPTTSFICLISRNKTRQGNIVTALEF